MRLKLLLGQQTTWSLAYSSHPSHLGDVAQLAEHLLCKQEAIGSSPIFSTMLGSLGVVQADAPEDVVREADPPSLWVPRPTGNGGSSASRTSGAGQGGCSSKGRASAVPLLGRGEMPATLVQVQPPSPHGDVAQSGRASVWQTEGCRFESDLLHKAIEHEVKSVRSLTAVHRGCGTLRSVAKALTPPGR